MSAFSLENVDVRIMIRSSGLTQYRVSREMGISESYFSRILRDPLSDETRAKVLAAIEALKKEA